MVHVAKFKVRENFYKPHNVQCSCGVGGDFASRDEARSWMETQHFNKLTGDSSFLFEDEKHPVPSTTTVPVRNPGWNLYKGTSPATLTKKAG